MNNREREIERSRVIKELHSMVKGLHEKIDALTLAALEKKPCECPPKKEKK